MKEGNSIEKLVTPSLEAMGFRVVRISFGGGSRPVLQIMAEPRDGSLMTVEHCATISRSVSAILDVEDPIPVAYVLEVTSPGIDRPLVAREDYRRFAGFEARLETARPIEGRKRFRGRLKPIDDADRVTIVEEAGSFTLPFADIVKAKLVLTDELIAASQPLHQPQPDPSGSAADKN